MATKFKPVTTSVRAEARGGQRPTGNLMDMQDSKHKGDSYGTDKTMMSFQLTRDLRERLREAAAERGTTSSRIIIDGIRHELGLDNRNI